MNKVCLKDWELFSERYNSKNYMSKDHKWLLKTSSTKNQLNIEELEEELRISNDALLLNIKTPLVKEIVELDDGGVGIVYQYIENKKSVSRAIGEDENSLEKNMEIFSKLGLELHNTKCDTTKFPNVEDKMYEFLSRQSILSEEHKNTMRKFIQSVKKEDTCLHGDFQPSNVIISPSGNYIIDLASLSYGNKMYDVGFWYLFSHYNHKGIMAEHFFHMPYDRVLKCWDAFMKYYFNVEDENEKKKLEEQIKPYAIVSILPLCITTNRDEYLQGILDNLYEDAFKEIS